MSNYEEAVLNLGKQVEAKYGIGILESAHPSAASDGKPWVTVVYPENKGQNKVYCHSAKLNEVKLIS